MTSHTMSGAHLSKNGEGSVVPREEHRSWISSLLGKGIVLDWVSCSNGTHCVSIYQEERNKKSDHH